MGALPYLNVPVALDPVVPVDHLKLHEGKSEGLCSIDLSFKHVALFARMTMQPIGPIRSSVVSMLEGKTHVPEFVPLLHIMYIHTRLWRQFQSLFMENLGDSSLWKEKENVDEIKDEDVD
ncbi:hypothetical protein M0R45_014589 [Rubus argutus]|uniref:Uncharacterized protein n=1 Tax=Rubus argutus TaxID=59490 RepID=A0AAW1XN01_RUBAR